MQAFRTVVDPAATKNQILPQSKIMLMGSCFAENIGKKLLDLKFGGQLNPFGILYNPQSIIHSLQFLLAGKTFTVDNVFEQNGVWNSFYHHSRFSNLNKDKLLESINGQLQKASQHLVDSNFLIITWGTAWVYQLKTTGQVVSNCHKLPASHFYRYRLSLEQIENQYRDILKQIHQINNKTQVVLTVSPVRHLKDGAIENQLSKSTLIMAAHKLAEQFKNVTYFPAYEIMMDDLRDYRFYNADMVHPSDVAVQYIWEAFKKSWVSDKSTVYLSELEKLHSALQHRPFQPEARSYQQFLVNQLQFIQQLKEKYKHADFSAEEDYFRSMLVK